MPVTCFECGNLIKGKAIGIYPPIYRIKLRDFPRSYHPSCYTKAEKKAEKETKANPSPAELGKRRKYETNHGKI